MKKLFVILLLVFVAGCNPVSTITEDDKVPVTVSKLATANKFDTITVIKDVEEWYVYDRGEYKETIPTTVETPTIVLMCMIFGFLIGVIVRSIFSD